MNLTRVGERLYLVALLDELNRKSTKFTAFSKAFQLSLFQCFMLIDEQCGRFSFCSDIKKLWKANQNQSASCTKRLKSYSILEIFVKTFWLICVISLIWYEHNNTLDKNLELWFQSSTISKRVIKWAMP